MYFTEHIPEFQHFRNVPRTGVIYVMSEAGKRGFYYGNEEWANLGQGAPETGALEGSPTRLEIMPVAPATHEYGPVAGIADLRDAVAQMYNRRYRKGRGSQYSAENVAISAGGRVGLTRVCAALSAVNLGHFLPDYTAYEELLEVFRGFVPIPILLQEDQGFLPLPEVLRREVIGMGLGAVLMSNPCNPTGQVIHGEALEQCVALARETHCLMIMDEFYSHYLYDELARDNLSISAAAHVDDVDRDPVVVIDGLTKNWRYPGLRLSWTVGPKAIIEHLTSAGSFLDGGAPHAIQRTAIGLLEPEVADAEARAIQAHFQMKRDEMMKRLYAMGIGPKAPTKGSFYCFADLSSLDEALRDGMHFFEEALKRRVICVPGLFFDVNPGKRRSHLPSRLSPYVRLSFGPPLEELLRGLDRFDAMIRSYV